jgi:hypothetical protein
MNGYCAKEKMTTMNFFKNLADQQNYREVLNEQKTFPVHEAATALFKISFHHNLIIIRKGYNEFDWRNNLVIKNDSQPNLDLL